MYAVLHSQIGLRDAGGLLSCITAASCSALLSNSLSCLIIAADKHMCTGTAPPTRTLFFFFLLLYLSYALLLKICSSALFLFVCPFPPLCCYFILFQPTIISCQSYISPRQMRIIPQTSANQANQDKDNVG